MKKSGKRLLAVVTAAVMMVMPAATAVAEGEETQADAVDQREAERQAAYAAAPETNSLTGWPQGPSTYGASAIVMDMNSGAVPYGKKIDEKHYPASITKLLTALVALENTELTDEVTVTNDSIGCLTYGDAHIGMQAGEILSMDDALHALLLASANEVAHAIAETVGAKLGGNYDTFIQKMNERAVELGCTGSHWVNPNGLHDDEHYTTAHDMALIASAVYQQEEFRKITQTLEYTIGPTNLVGESRSFQQKHKMLWPGNENYYEYATGGKTGYTDKARTTLVTMADNGELQLAAVVLYDFGADAYVDTSSMFNYVFDNFSKVMLADQTKPEEVESFAEGAYVLLPNGVEFGDLKSSVSVTDETQRTGIVKYTYQGQNVGSAQVMLTEEYLSKESGNTAAEDGEAQEKENDAGMALPVKILIIAGSCIVALVVLGVIFIVYLRYRRKRRRLMRRRRRRQVRRRNEEMYRRTHRDEY